MYYITQLKDAEIVRKRLHYIDLIYTVEKITTKAAKEVGLSMLLRKYIFSTLANEKANYLKFSEQELQIITIIQ